MLIKIEAQLLQIGSAILLSVLTMSAADAASAPQAVKNTFVISQEVLKTQPHIIFQGMIQAVIKSDAAAVKILLPLYQAQPGYDENLAAWGKAILAKEEGNYRDAIRYYRRVIAKEPQLNIARLQLAIALFQNKDRASALLQFNKLREIGPLGNNLIFSGFNLINVQNLTNQSQQ